MQFSTILLTLVSAATSALAVTAAYDTTYDTSSLSTLVLACSDGVNGLYTKGYQTLGSVPNYPYVGAVETVAGWNSANCGKCYSVTYGSTTIKVTAVDHAASGVWLWAESMLLIRRLLVKSLQTFQVAVHIR
ncbi:uncharacterized protein LAJ45_00774 [Morchella importuna]|uniref:uncharacterized protein n=1 Tax=Morchella importuna TaxID=1174673 RepID=UPI001E8D4B0F|nr:uncharacterized protein LAJ45_00774 [Morchella importuna]KAH8155764.1 hypothetical protein LAJ45_00774 [Morchella importuna]